MIKNSREFFEIYSIFLNNCIFYSENQCNNDSELLLAKLILSYSYYLPIIGNVNLESLNKSIIFDDYSDDLFKSKWICDFMFKLNENSKINLYKWFFSSLLKQHINSKESTDNKLELWKGAWVTLLNKKYLYKRNKEYWFPDFSYLFDDACQKLSKFTRLEHEKIKTSWEQNFK